MRREEGQTELWGWSRDGLAVMGGEFRAKVVECYKELGRDEKSQDSIVLMDVGFTCLLVVTFTRIISAEWWGWKPYCGGLKSELEVRKETKKGLLSLGAQLWREKNMRAGPEWRKGFYVRGKMLSLFVC